MSWRSDDAWVAPPLRRVPRLEWNLGAAHGVPGIIGFLGGVCAADVDARTTRRAHALLEKAVAWLLAQELPRTSAARFAAGIGPGVPKTPARTAWCYGDPGIAVTLLAAAHAIGERAWEKTAVRIALASAARTGDDRRIAEASLCHGAGGLAGIYSRFYLTTGDARFAGAARASVAEMLAMRDGSRGFAGFRSNGLRRDGKLGWRADPGFLTGAAGIALVLVSATNDAEPAWDRALLFSVREGRARAPLGTPAASGSPRGERP